MGGDWNAAWVAALDTLEADVTEVEQLLEDDHRMRDHPISDAWQPPTGLGPLPLDLRPRADAILSRQLIAARTITQTIATNRRQAAVTARIETGSAGTRRPAYIDCAM